MPDYAMVGYLLYKGIRRNLIINDEENHLYGNS